MGVNIKDILLNLGISPNYTGYYYLVELISERLKYLQDPKSLKAYSICEEYKRVGAVYNVTSASVERCTRHIIQKICKMEQPLLNILCRTQMFNKKHPTNKGFVFAIAEHINKLNNTQGE